MQRYSCFLWRCYYAVVIVISFIACVLLAVQLALSNIDRFKPLLIEQLQQQFALKLSVDNVHAEWSDGRIRLQATDVVVQHADSAFNQVQLAHAEFELGVVESLSRGYPVFSQFLLDRPELKFDLSMLPKSSSATTAQPQLPLWLLAIPVNIQQAELTLLINGQSLTYHRINSQLARSVDQYQLTLSAERRLSAELSEPALSMTVEGMGDPLKNKLAAYIKLGSLPYDLVNNYLPSEYRINTLKSEHELWLNFEEGKLQNATGAFDIEHLSIVDNQHKLSATASLALIPKASGVHQLQLHQAKINNGSVLNLPDVAVDLGKNWQPQNIQSPQILLAPIKQWLVGQAWLPKEVKEIVAALNPIGVINNLHAVSNSGFADQYSLKADLSGISIDAWDDVPALSGINGLLIADQDSGAVHLVSRAFEMEYPTLFTERMKYQQADGVIRWQLFPDAAIIGSDLLHLKEEKIEAYGRFSLYLPFSNQLQTQLTLMIGTQGADATVTGRYVPPEEIGQETYDWLVGAIRAGHVNTGIFLLNGATRSRLDDYQMPVVQLYFDVSDADFAYQPGWPSVKSEHAEFMFKDGGLVVEMPTGKLLNSDVEQSWAYMPMSGDYLTVAGLVKGDAKDIHHLLVKTPLRQEVGDALDDWSMRGTVATEVRLGIPIVDDNPVLDINVETLLNKVSFKSSELDLSLSNAVGRIRYDTPYGLSAEKIKASILGSTATIDISSKSDAKKLGIHTQMTMRSRVSTDKLSNWLGFELKPMVEGQVYYRAQVDICESIPGCSQVSVASNLKGAEVKLPAGLAKQPDIAKPLFVSVGLQKNAPIRLSYDDQLYMALDYRGDKVERARINLSEQNFQLPAKGVFKITGAVKTIDSEVLQQFLTGLGLDKQSGLSAGLRTDLSVDIGQFKLPSFSIYDLHTELVTMSDGVHLAVRSKNFDGSALFPADGSPYQVDIARLNLVKNGSSATQADSDSQDVSELESQDLPAARVSIANLRVNNKPLGQWSFDMMPDSDGAIIDNIKGQLDNFQLTGDVHWQTDSEQSSVMNVQINGTDIAELLTRWEFERAMETEEAIANIHLTWPGSPWGFSLSESSGVIDFVAKDGRILETGTGTGLLRLFGILNLNTLGRRLKLDFSDLFLAGVAFDRLAGDYRIDKGVAYTRTPFKMQGPSVDMSIQGNIDLINETLDQQMEVTLPLTANLPIMSVLLGQPQIASAVFLIDKLIGDKLEKLSTLRYTMKGDWSEPEIDIAVPKNNQQLKATQPWSNE